jgi:hypothetical protein
MDLSTPSGPNFAGSWVALRKQGRRLKARSRSPGPRPSDAGLRSRLPDWTRLDSHPEARGLARKIGPAPGADMKLYLSRNLTPRVASRYDDESSMTFPRPAYFTAALPRRPGAGSPLNEAPIGSLAKECGGRADCGHSALVLSLQTSRTLRRNSDQARGDSLWYADRMLRSEPIWKAFKKRCG